MVPYFLYALYSVKISRYEETYANAQKKAMTRDLLVSNSDYDTDGAYGIFLNCVIPM